MTRIFKNLSVVAALAALVLTPAVHAKSVKISSKLKKALCSQNPAQALGLLNNEASTPGNNLLAAVALHQGGKSISARELLAGLARGNHADRIKLKCKGGPNFDAGISAVAAEYLVTIQRELIAHDVMLVPKKQLHAALPPMKDPAESSPAKGTMHNKAADQLKLNIKIEMPASANLNGTWFTHFASYFDEAKATAGIEILEKRYGTLKGAVDFWRVQSANGSVWRVGVAVDEWSDADRLCISVRASGDYCKVYDRLQ